MQIREIAECFQKAFCIIFVLQ